MSDSSMDSSDEDLPSLPHGFSPFKQKKGLTAHRITETIEDRVKEQLKLASTFKVENGVQSHIEEKLKHTVLLKTKNHSFEEPGPETAANEEFKIFCVKEPLQFFNVLDVTPVNCGYDERSELLTKYETDLLKFIRAELQNVLSSFLLSCHPGCVSDCKSFIKFLLHSISISNDAANVNACYDCICTLLTKHRMAVYLVFDSIEIFMVLFNYGIDREDCQILKWKPGLQSLSPAQFLGKSFNKIPNNWTYNFEFILKSFEKLISTCHINYEDLCDILIYFLWIGFDSRVQSENLCFHLQECISACIQCIPEDSSNSLADVASCIISMDFAGEIDKWNTVYRLTESIPNSSRKCCILKKHVAFKALSHICSNKEDAVSSEPKCTIQELQLFLPEFSGMKSESMLLMAAKFVDLSTCEVDSNIEEYNQFCNHLKKVENSLIETAHLAKSHLCKTHARLKRLAFKSPMYSLPSFQRKQECELKKRSSPVQVKKEINLYPEENDHCEKPVMVKNIKSEPGVNPGTDFSSSSIVVSSVSSCADSELPESHKELGLQLPPNDETSGDPVYSELPRISSVSSSSGIHMTLRDNESSVLPPFVIESTYSLNDQDASCPKIVSVESQASSDEQSVDDSIRQLFDLPANSGISSQGGLFNHTDSTHDFSETFNSSSMNDDSFVNSSSMNIDSFVKQVLIDIENPNIVESSSSSFDASFFPSSSKTVGPKTNVRNNESSSFDASFSTASSKIVGPKTNVRNNESLSFDASFSTASSKIVGPKTNVRNNDVEEEIVILNEVESSENRKKSNKSSEFSVSKSLDRAEPEIIIMENNNPFSKQDTGKSSSTMSQANSMKQKHRIIEPHHSKVNNNNDDITILEEIKSQSKFQKKASKPSSQSKHKDVFSNIKSASTTDGASKFKYLFPLCKDMVVLEIPVKSGQSVKKTPKKSPEIEALSKRSGLSITSIKSTNEIKEGEEIVVLKEVKSLNKNHKEGAKQLHKHNSSKRKRRESVEVLFMRQSMGHEVQEDPMIIVDSQVILALNALLADVGELCKVDCAPVVLETIVFPQNIPGLECVPLKETLPFDKQEESSLNNTESRVEYSPRRHSTMSPKKTFSSEDSIDRLLSCGALLEETVHEVSLLHHLANNTLACAETMVVAESVIDSILQELSFDEFIGDGKNYVSSRQTGVNTVIKNLVHEVSFSEFMLNSEDNFAFLATEDSRLITPTTAMTKQVQCTALQKPMPNAINNCTELFQSDNYKPEQNLNNHYNVEILSTEATLNIEMKNVEDISFEEPTGNLAVSSVSSSCPKDADFDSKSGQGMSIVPTNFDNVREKLEHKVTSKDSLLCEMHDSTVPMFPPQSLEELDPSDFNPNNDVSNRKAAFNIVMTIGVEDVPLKEPMSNLVDRVTTSTSKSDSSHAVLQHSKVWTVNTDVSNVQSASNADVANLFSNNLVQEASIKELAPVLLNNFMAPNFVPRVTAGNCETNSTEEICPKEEISESLKHILESVVIMTELTLSIDSDNSVKHTELQLNVVEKTGVTLNSVEVNKEKSLFTDLVSGFLAQRALQKKYSFATKKFAKTFTALSPTVSRLKSPSPPKSFNVIPLISNNLCNKAESSSEGESSYAKESTFSGDDGSIKEHSPKTLVSDLRSSLKRKNFNLQNSDPKIRRLSCSPRKNVDDPQGSSRPRIKPFSPSKVYPCASKYSFFSRKHFSLKRKSSIKSPVKLSPKRRLIGKRNVRGKSILSKTGLALSPFLRQKLIPLSSDSNLPAIKKEMSSEYNSDSDIEILYMDPKYYADNDCLIVYEEDEVTVLD